VDAVWDNGQVTNGEKAGGDQQTDEKALVFLMGVTVEILLAFLAAGWLPSIWCSIVLVVVVIETARRNGFLRRGRAGAWPAATALAVGLGNRVPGPGPFVLGLSMVAPGSVDRDGSTYQRLLSNPRSHSMIRRVMRQELRERNQA
jgi:hypothetical protein